MQGLWYDGMTTWHWWQSPDIVQMLNRTGQQGLARKEQRTFSANLDSFDASTFAAWLGSGGCGGGTEATPWRCREVDMLAGGFAAGNFW